MILYAGGDWSGNADDDEDVLIACVAALPDAEAWSAVCRDLRPKFGMARYQEFHGHEINGKPENTLTFLKAAREGGMQVGAAVLRTGDKEPYFTGERTYADLAVSMMTRFLPICPLKALWYDEEIQGRRAIQEFETAIHRCNRALHATGNLRLHSRNSRTSNLIQLADVTAYVLRRWKSGLLDYQPLRTFVKEVVADENNLIEEMWWRKK